MITTSLNLILAAALPQGPGSSTAPVVINEFSYDDTGSNNRCFVELYNRSGAQVDISNWVLQGVDGTSTGNANVIIPAGTLLDAGDFYVIGQAEAVPPVASTGVPNVDLDVPGMATVMETGADGLVLQDALGTDIDGVTYEQASWTNPIPTWLEGDGLWGDILNSDSNPQSASRVFDGYDSDSNGRDFRLSRWSPGVSNSSAHTSGPAYSNDFDGAVGADVAADFSYSFVPGTTEDPAILGIAASPQGGNCSVWYDPAGGGNVNFFSAESRSDWVMECYVYLRGPEATFDTNDIETWAIGVRGSTDSFGEPADVNGLYTFAGATWQAGITGIAFMQIITATTSDLYVVDFNDGGSDFTVLHGPIAVATDGWERLRLSVLDDTLVANIGGTFGCDDGNRLLASGITDSPNGVFVQYRENVSAAGAHRPLAIDALRIAPGSGASIAVVGSGSPNTTGLPSIDTGGETPYVGNAAFSIQGGNLTANSLSITAFSLGAPTLPGQQIGGAAPGALVFLPNVIYTSLSANSPTGTSSLPYPIPCITTLANLPLGVQIFDLDPALSQTVQVATSAALSLSSGNLPN